MALTRPKYSSILDTDFKVSCKVATTGSDIPLTGGAPSTLDGQSLSVGDRVLVRDQSLAWQNGIYVVSTVGTGSNGTWSRARDFAASQNVTSGILIPVTQGNTRGGRIYLLTTPDPIVLNTTDLAFTDVTFAGANTVSISNANVSTSTTTGAFTVTGGVGIGGNIYVGGNANITGTANITGNTNVGNIGTTDIVVTGNSNLNGIANVKISGGSSGQFIQTDGTGNLSFVTLSPNSIFNGNSNVSVAANSNVTVSVGGNANIVTVTDTGANVSGYLTITGDITAGNIELTSNEIKSSTGNIAIILDDINVTIPGNLTVQGTRTEIGTQDLTVQDSLINLHTAANLEPLVADDGRDIGLVFHYYKGSDKQAFLGLANDTTSLEFYVEGIESNVGTFSGTYGNIRARTFDVVTSTLAPFTVRSTIQVANLNAAVAGSLVNGNSNVLVAANSNVTVSVEGNANIVTVTGTGANVSGTLNVTGNANVGNLGTVDIVATGVSNLNSISNVKITGGSSGQFIQTDGAGNLSFVTLSPSSIFNGNSNVSVAANSNVTISVAGNANVVTVTDVGANIAGTLDVTGNINSGLLQNGNSNVAIAANSAVSIAANGAVRATFAANGNVGIGTATPLQRLTVENTSITGGGPATSGSSADPNAVARFRANNTVLDFGVYSSASMWLQTRLASNYATNYNLAINPNGGSVSIGTGAPFQPLQLEKNNKVDPPYFLINNKGTLTTDTSTYAQGGLLFGAYSSLNNPAYVASITVERKSQSSGTSSSGDIIFGTNATASGTLPTEKVRIDANGNVGIGNSAPTHALSVTGNINVSGNANVGNIGTTGFTATGVVNLGSNANVKITGGTLNQFLRTDGAGNLSWSSSAGGGITYTVSATAPSSPTTGDQWYDTSTDIFYTYIDDGSSTYWLDLTSLPPYPTFTSSTTAPSSPTDGDYWYDTDAGILYVRINDGTSSLWLDLTSAPRVPISTASSTAPTTPTPEPGDFWWDTVDEVLYVRAGAPGSDFWLDISSQPNTFAAITTINANVTSNLIVANANVTAALVIGGTTTSQSIIPSANNTYTLGNSTNRYSNIWGLASSAQYADLAERYLADKPYEPGTVVVFGGSAEITVTVTDHDPRIAGVVSTDPAYLMNDSADKGNLWLPIALQGRVPTRVQGPVRKGDLLVSSSESGIARKMNKALYEPGCVIGKSLEDHYDDTVKVIEVVVGRI